MKTINIILTILSYFLLLRMTYFAYDNEGIVGWFLQTVTVLIWSIILAIGFYTSWTAITKELIKKE